MKKILIILGIIFFPITILIGIVYLVYKFFSKKRIHTFLSNVNISDIDAITGVQFEEIVAVLFDYFGYKTKLTKRSGDYGVDIFASFKDVRYCIQTKLYYNHNVGSSAIQEINTAKNYYMCDYAVVITNSKYTKQALDMAENLNVILINRIDLVNILQAYKSKNKRFMRRLLEEKA